MLTLDAVKNMNYVQLLAQIEEINRPPGGKDSIRKIVQNTFLAKDSYVLDVGCNTGYSSFEMVHLVKCKAIGLDISPEMIATANKFKQADAYGSNIEFKVGDGMNLPFEDETFDLTMSGGSTAFIDDKVKALKEYARVTKTWGFVADVNFFYKQPPPIEMIEKLNQLMGINIKPWNKEYWVEVYNQVDLETYYTFLENVYVPSKEQIYDYCAKMSEQVEAEPNAVELIRDRLIEIMTLFTENHKYLAYGVFILRKRNEPEQISLFGA